MFSWLIGPRSQRALAAALASELARAIRVRQDDPARFALFHSAMVLQLDQVGIRRGRRWHAYWARRYWARAIALGITAQTYRTVLRSLGHFQLGDLVPRPLHLAGPR